MTLEWLRNKEACVCRDIVMPDGDELKEGDMVIITRVFGSPDKPLFLSVRPKNSVGVIPMLTSPSNLELLD